MSSNFSSKGKKEEDKNLNVQLIDQTKTNDTLEPDSIVSSTHKINPYPCKNKDNESSDCKLSNLGIVTKKEVKQALINRNVTFRTEYNRLPINLEAEIFFKGPSERIYQQYHLSLNKDYLVLYKALNKNSKNKISNLPNIRIAKNNFEFKNVSGINLYFKNIFDIYHPKFCLNFNLITSFLTTIPEKYEILINVLSSKIITYKLKIINKNKELYIKILDNLQSTIINSRGYYINLLGITLRNNFSSFYFMKASEFEYKAKTGDILLFKGFECPARLQRFYTKNEYDHVAILKKKNGILYVYEATSKDGCKERKWQEFLNYLWYLLYDKMVFRELIIKAENNDEKLLIEKNIGRKCEEFLKSTQGKKYKMYLGTICCGSKKKNNYINHWKDKKGFICSSLIMGAYLQMEICEYTKNINQFLPGDFSQDKKLPFTSKFELGPEIIIDFSL